MKQPILFINKFKRCFNVGNIISIAINSDSIAQSDTIASAARHGMASSHAITN